MLSLAFLSISQQNLYTTNDQQIVFAECATILPINQTINMLSVDSQKSICVKGSFLLGAELSYSLTSALPTKNGWNISHSNSHGIGTVSKNGDVITKIKCESKKKACRFQLLPIFPSKNIIKDKNGTKLTIIQKSFISTVTNNKLTLINQKTSSENEITVRKTFATIASKNVLEFSYKKNKGDIINSTLTSNSLEQDSESGAIGKSDVALFFPTMKEDNFNNKVELSIEKASNKNDVWLLPEINATVPTMDGIITHSDLVKRPIISEYELFVLVISLIGFSIIIVYSVFFIMRKRKMRRSINSSNEVNTESLL
ncbi:hypothetical protein TVAG_250020 [Trichomonas vaginalis G3]|uniref:Uncharacterized protein n=1 Tax=Trichomonas vaginalis (strain ATCC PRA-98 / G3) TaxID=412133 RepID=A2DCK5_TRIV3|nr:hypothetical protein TVAGG3_0956310 [Trichomonas vaginalis G3]EAY21942.1 hypothetical protein TVAG_250020 [Trichomonas vaginalis G3]KAI5487582.1 hypothetical protein TVAGG3_0956310 [Trichomonas vaginalis G3]|eukprot:XP_001582928.1 hypothetical protein [Trichomonas vaginalis G3]